MCNTNLDTMFMERFRNSAVSSSGNRLKASLCSDVPRGVTFRFESATSGLQHQTKNDGHLLDFSNSFNRMYEICEIYHTHRYNDRTGSSWTEFPRAASLTHEVVSCGGRLQQNFRL